MAKSKATLFVAFTDRELLDPMMVAIEQEHELEPLLEHLRVDWVLQEILESSRDVTIGISWEC